MFECLTLIQAVNAMSTQRAVVTSGGTFIALARARTFRCVNLRQLHDRGHAAVKARVCLCFGYLCDHPMPFRPDYFTLSRHVCLCFAASALLAGPGIHADSTGLQRCWHAHVCARQRSESTSTQFEIHFANLKIHTTFGFSSTDTFAVVTLPRRRLEAAESAAESAATDAKEVDLDVSCQAFGRPSSSEQRTFGAAILQVAWHPLSNDHLLVLAADNTLSYALHMMSFLFLLVFPRDSNSSCWSVLRLLVIIPECST